MTTKSINKAVSNESKVTPTAPSSLTPENAAAASEQNSIALQQASSKKKRSAVEQRERLATIHKWVRLGIQILFFVFAPALFSAAFNGVKYIFTQIGLLQGVEMTSFVVLLIAALGFTIVFGRFFCGYACAFGTLGDVLHGIAKFLCAKLGVSLPVFPDPLVKALALVKYAILAAICIACATGAWSLVSGYSPWTAFAGVLAFSVDGIDPVAFLLLAAIMLGMILRERFFCQFLCPLGAVFSLMPVFKFSEYTRVRAHCARTCGKCQQTCPVDIWPDADRFMHGECIACGRCADACPMNNVNLIAVEKAEAKRARLEKEGEGFTDEPRPLRKTNESWYLLRGTGIGVIMVKAIVLFVLCWIVGSTRIVPPFSSIMGLF